MLKTHIKEELMQGEEADAVYESMAHLSTDLLMKCSLNPGCDEDLYESMAAFAPAATEDLCKWPSPARLASTLLPRNSFLHSGLLGGSPCFPLPYPKGGRSCFTVLGLQLWVL